MIEDRTGYKDIGAQVARTANRNGRQYMNTAVATEMHVRNTNQSTAALNSRIMPVLASVSGKGFDTPKAMVGLVDGLQRVLRRRPSG